MSVAPLGSCGAGPSSCRGGGSGTPGTPAARSLYTPAVHSRHGSGPPGRTLYAAPVPAALNKELPAAPGTDDGGCVDENYMRY